MLSLFATLAAVAAVASPQPLQSWADPSHGWKVVGDNVASTGDGGRTWRTILRGGGSPGDITSLVRTSASAGMVVITDSPLVTVDGGRHWYVSDFPAADGSTPFGSGRELLWVTGSLERATNWPPAAPRCGGHWYHTFTGPLPDYGPSPRNICLGGFGVHLGHRVVFAFPQGESSPELLPQQVVPGGLLLFGVDQHDNRIVQEVVVYRNGAARVRTLPGPAPVEAHAFVHWPELAIVARNGSWVSPDGGGTWTSVP